MVGIGKFRDESALALMSDDGELVESGWKAKLTYMLLTVGRA